MTNYYNFHISVISPVYKAEAVLEELVSRISSSVESITDNYEIILVDDRSPDRSWEKMVAIANANPRVRAIRLSRNFGQHYAITTGIDIARGEWIVVMDCDLQDKPEEITSLYKKACEGFDVVLARRFERKDRLVKRMFSKIFYRTLGYLTGTHQDESVANFGIYNSKVISSVKSLRESIRYFPTMVQWVGFETTSINVEHAERSQGKSNYNFDKLLRLALDIMLAFSDKPIRMVIKFGLFIALLSFVFVGFTLYKWLNNDIEVLGYASLIISIWFLTGCTLVTIGVVGLYVGKTFEGVKNRPLYIIDKDVSCSLEQIQKYDKEISNCEV
ncbi:glycosyltransferase family 2 protein [Pontibacter kalidii]|uniref:glycosyltransferase family 2 protein n=1 Tax=Pontibacter kalidii TaxID=2592049 RepID=UPI002256E4CE|nr:glycosyltransferase family 2 protein [Pontibacter kalidii]